MKKIYTLLLFLCVISLMAKAQENKKSDGEAVSFLKITPDARSAGMGDIGIALPQGAYAFYHNSAASLFTSERGAVSYSYTPWMRDLVSGNSLHSISGFFKIGNKQSLVLGFRNFTHAESRIMDENGNPGKTFKPSEWALDLGYSRLVTKNLGMSLTFRYISSDMGSYQGAKSANAMAFDLGVFYRQNTHWFEGASYAIGLQVANIGTKIKYLDTKYDLPGKISLGGSVGLPFSKSHVLNCGLDLGYQLMPSGSSNFDAGLGVEYVLLQHASIRAGYHLGDKDKGYDSYATVGCGLRFYHIQGDFSYLLAGSDCPLKNTFRFTIGIDFGLFCSKK